MLTWRVEFSLAGDLGGVVPQAGCGIGAFFAIPWSSCGIVRTARRSLGVLAAGQCQRDHRLSGLLNVEMVADADRFRSRIGERPRRLIHEIQKLED